MSGFNRQWSAVESVKDARGRKVAYKFTCGCGELTKFDSKHFTDPYGAARLAMEIHVCPDLTEGGQVK